MTWLTALTAWPAPIGPTWVIVRPIAVEDRPGALDVRRVAADEDRQRRVAGALAAARDRGVDHRAGRARRAARRSPSCPDGAIVEQSMTRVPCRAPSTTPSGPNRTASTSGVSETQITAMSDAGDRRPRASAHVTPRSASSGARPGVRFQPVTRTRRGPGWRPSPRPSCPGRGRRPGPAPGIGSAVMVRCAASLGGSADSVASVASVVSAPSVGRAAPAAAGCPWPGAALVTPAGDEERGDRSDDDDQDDDPEQVAAVAPGRFRGSRSERGSRSGSGWRRRPG